VPDSVLLDTNVAIDIATDHSLAARYRLLIEGRTQALSFASAAELTYTSLRARDPFSASVHRRGRPRQDNDLWIAATALRHGLPLVTHNIRDFADIPDLTVISEAPDAH
jgi:predicted nucleic acid-binding protein